MPKKKIKTRDREYKEGVDSYNAWKRENKKFEKMGLHGTDYYIRRMEELSAKVQLLERMLKKERKN